MQLGFLRLRWSEMLLCQGLGAMAAGGSPRHTLHRRPHAARHSGGDGGVLRCYFNIMYVCMYV